ncbi:DUF3943 domain-containing protein [Dysgonomonas sp. Marseille-P4677]|uniref:DUF3943 domain-containing protein n=1 Tax=Dysgonomonas sp. Marseille-P4677 TaxID=2364790 RepID=UPI00191311EF|nr:DUF3943 domain-containing protein [Dysgonomonas sp. Marseille-P4677]MBK5723005.1 DUF3943 domain-containing protein [Dysgonomonas sp. Marseille-P4677]
MEDKKFISKQGNRYFFILLLLFVYVLNAEAQKELDVRDITIKSDTLKTTPSSIVKNFKIDASFSGNIYKKNFMLIPSKVNIYDLPYSIKGHYPNYKRLGLNTTVLAGAGVLTLGVLHSLPEDATSWNKKEIMDVPPFKRWWRNVKKGPVVDKDNAIFNYVLHPYGGAAYYMGARSVGFSALYSFFYSAAISTFLWEYGFEAFMEIPSIQDLVLTPVAGLIIGEGFYVLKRHIVSNGYELFGSSIVGNVVAYLIDPINEVIGIFAGNPNRGKNKKIRDFVVCTPWLSPSENSMALGFTVNLSF